MVAADLRTIGWGVRVGTIVVIGLLVGAAPVLAGVSTAATGSVAVDQSAAGDPLEEDDTRANATVVDTPRNGTRSVNYTGLTVRSGDRDVFAVNLSVGDRLNVTLAHDGANASDVSVAVSPPDRSSFTRLGFTRPQRLNITARQAGTYHVTVVSTQSRPTGFRLGLAVTAVAPDRREEDDTQANATRVVTPPVGSGSTTFGGGNVRRGDDDTFAVDLSEGDELAVTLAHDGANASDVALVVKQQANSFTRSGFTRPQRLNITADRSGTVYIRVSTDRVRPIDYRLKVGTTVIPARDHLEPDDSRWNATTVPTPVAGARTVRYTGLTVREGDRDQFAVNLSAGDRLNLTLAHDGANASDVSVAVKPNRSSFTRLGFTRPQRFNLTVDQSGTYRVSVVGDRPTLTQYRLRVRVNATGVAGGITPLEPRFNEPASGGSASGSTVTSPGGNATDPGISLSGPAIAGPLSEVGLPPLNLTGLLPGPFGAFDRPDDRRTLGDSRGESLAPTAPRAMARRPTG